VTPLEAIDREVAGKRASELADDIAGDAITLVRNDAKLLPLNLASTTRVFNLAITNGDDRAFITQSFVGAMSRGGIKMETVVLDDRSSDADVAKAIDKGSRADTIIVSMYGRVRSGQARSVALRGRGIYAEDGAPVGMTGVVQDITERIQAEEVRDRLSALVSSSEDAIIKAMNRSWRMSAVTRSITGPMNGCGSAIGWSTMIRSISLQISATNSSCLPSSTISLRAAVQRCPAER